MTKCVSMSCVCCQCVRGAICSTFLISLAVEGVLHGGAAREPRGGPVGGRGAALRLLRGPSGFVGKRKGALRRGSAAGTLRRATPRQGIHRTSRGVIGINRSVCVSLSLFLILRVDPSPTPLSSGPGPGPRAATSRQLPSHNEVVIVGVPLCAPMVTRALILTSLGVEQWMDKDIVECSF